MTLRIEDLQPGFAEKIEAAREKALDEQAMQRPNVVAELARLREVVTQANRMMRRLAYLGKAPNVRACYLEARAMLTKPAKDAAEPTDRDMLDWLEAQKPKDFDCVLFEYIDGDLAAVNFCTPDYDDDSQFYTGDGWRSAIRAAMKDTECSTKNESN